MNLKKTQHPVEGGKGGVTICKIKNSDFKFLITS